MKITDLKILPIDRYVEIFGLFIWEPTDWVQREAMHGLEADRFDAVPTRPVAFDPIDPRMVHAEIWLAFRGHSNGIFRSIDSGDSWVNITHNLGPEFTP